MLLVLALSVLGTLACTLALVCLPPFGSASGPAAWSLSLTLFLKCQIPKVPLQGAHPNLRSIPSQFDEIGWEEMLREKVCVKQVLDVNQ